MKTIGAGGAALIGAVVLFAAFTGTVAKTAGRFEGKLVVEALQDGRNLRVMRSFTYIDPNGRKWFVPAGANTDGASVPRVFWSLFPPFSGRHRKAAVVHDHYCQTRYRPWRAVHRMFYDAMRTAGVGITSANAMYAAVYSFGPRWSSIGSSRSISYSDLPDAEQEKALRALRDWMDKEKPTPQQIERRINETRMRDLGTKLIK